MASSLASLSPTPSLELSVPLEESHEGKEETTRPSTAGLQASQSSSRLQATSSGSLKSSPFRTSHREVRHSESGRRARSKSPLPSSSSTTVRHRSVSGSASHIKSSFSFDSAPPQPSDYGSLSPSPPSASPPTPSSVFLKGSQEEYRQLEYGKQTPPPQKRNHVGLSTLPQR